MPIPEYIRNIRLKIGQDLLYMPGVLAVVLNPVGQVLLQRRKDNGMWNLPGGIMEPDEEPAEATAREVLEETGIRVVPDRLGGVYAHGPVLYPNGDYMKFLSLVFVCHPVDIDATPGAFDDESIAAAYFAPDALPQLEDRHQHYLASALRGGLKADFVFTLW